MTAITVALADTAAARHAHHRLRHAVFCAGLGYEPGADGEERDPWDAHAVPFLARDGDDWTGTLRLILPGPLGLPMATIATLSPSAAALVEQGRVAEISRLCVASRSGSAPLFAALIRAAVAHAHRAGIDYLCCLAALALIRLFGRLGIADGPAGDGCEHHGPRYPRIGATEPMHRALSELADSGPYAGRLAGVAYVRASELAGVAP